MRSLLALVAIFALQGCEGRSPVEPATSFKRTVAVAGRVQDANTGALVPSRIEFRRDLPGSLTTGIISATGTFSLCLEPDRWDIRVTAQDYRETTTWLLVGDHSTSIVIGMRKE